MLNRYEPLVSTQYLSIDRVIYWLLLSILHPWRTWIFSIIFYHYSNNTKYLVYSTLVSLSHYISHLNEIHKSRGSKDTDLKRILITGGSRGLGLAIVKNSLKFLNVDKIFIIDIIEPLEDLDQGRVVFHKCDISDLDKVDQVIDKIINESKINLLINNAGIRHDKPLTKLSQMEVDKIFKVNTMAPIQICRRLIKFTTKLHVITISSILGTIGPKNLSVYSASKAATILIHESLSFEMSDNIHMKFTLFLPGQLDTEMFKEVDVSHKFLAPVLDANKFSLKIIEVIRQGKRGIYCFPFYCNFIPLLRCLPYGLYEFLRRFSKMDEQIKPTIIQEEVQEVLL